MWYLDDLIAALKKEDPEAVTRIGLCNPHSSRPDYADLGFEPCGPMKVKDILALVESCLGKVYEGYKGGSYRAENYTGVYFEHWGQADVETFGPIMFAFLMGRDPTEGIIRPEEIMQPDYYESR